MYWCSVNPMDFIVDINTYAPLWTLKDDISSDKDSVRKNIVYKIICYLYMQYIIQLNTP